MKYNNQLLHLLNLNHLKLTNKTICCNKKGLPTINCNIKINPNFIALYSQKSLYNKTNKTAVAFYEFDIKFDGPFGLFWAIKYDIKERLEYFKERFKEVRCFIMPDISTLGDNSDIENEYALYKARVISLWFIFELGAVVIPNISFPTEESSAFALDGFENCSVVAISTKGHIREPKENKRLRENVKVVVDKLHNLKTIIVYDVCGSDEKTIEIFSYAISKGIKIIIPNNTLKERNRVLHQQKIANKRSKV